MDSSRRVFQEELDSIRVAVLELAASVSEAIPRATRILLESDLEGAEYLINDDARVDDACVTIEQQCIEVLRLQAPVAHDLRLVLSVMRILAEIERSSDLLVNICKASRRLAGHPLDAGLRSLIDAMSVQAQQLHIAAIDAFVHNDAAKATALNDMDSFLDDLYGRFMQAIFESHAAGRIDVQAAVQLAVVARFYERVGDHAVTIGERIYYMLTAHLPTYIRADH